MAKATFIILFYVCALVAADPVSSDSDKFSKSAQTSNHGNPKLICRSAGWSDVLAFFLINYVAHAATLKSIPGESAPVTILNLLAALFFPSSGVFRGFDALKSLAKFGATDLEVAARAGALCTVVRWPPEAAGRKAKLDKARLPRPIWSILESSIHGNYRLPAGYALAIVRHDAEFENDTPPKRNIWRRPLDLFRPARPGTTKLSCSYNAVKILIALIQLLYSIVTMYQSRGDQINRYGFSAFGLTVAPYAWMSFVNLFANLLCPEYPSLYLVESRAMRLMQQSQSTGNEVSFDGVVGRLNPSSDQRMEDYIARLGEEIFTTQAPILRNRVKALTENFVLSGFASVVPIAIIGSISRFRPGTDSSPAQLVFVGLWLLYGVYFGVISHLLSRVFEERPILNTWSTSRRSRKARPVVALTFLFGFVAVLGFYEVGRMIVVYGVCV